MACGKYHWPHELTSIGSRHSHYIALTIHLKSCHARLEIYLASTPQYLVTDIGNYRWQTVCAYMRMCGIEDACLCSKLTQPFQHTLRIASFLASCKELSIAKSTSSSFSKTEIRFRIDFLLACDKRHITTTIGDILATFEHYWLDAQFYEFQGSKQTSGTKTDNHRLTVAFHLMILFWRKRFGWRILVDIDINVELNHDLSLAGIDAAVYRAQPSDSLWRYGILFGNLLFKFLLVGPYLWPYPDAYILYHLNSNLNASSTLETGHT